MNKVNLNELNLNNKAFWYAFFTLSYPNGYEEELDLSVGDIAGELADMDWWDDFTGYDEETFDENDGYSDEPTYIEIQMGQDKLLKVEFHPGDILYYVNGKQVGSTGPHFELQVFSFEEMEQLMEQENGEILFWLMLPLAKIPANHTDEVTDRLAQKLKVLFEADMCEELAGCMVQQFL